MDELADCSCSRLEADAAEMAEARLLLVCTNCCCTAAVAATAVLYMSTCSSCEKRVLGATLLQQQYMQRLATTKMHRDLKPAAVPDAPWHCGRAGERISVIQAPWLAMVDEQIHAVNSTCT